MITPDFVPHMLAQLEDELARSRKREAFWISVIVHIVLVLLVIYSPQWLPDWAQPHLLRAEDLARSKEPTYLALPQDMQKPPPKVHADKLSDKNRIAQTTHPQIDSKTLDALREARGNQRPPEPQAAAPMPQQAMPQAAPPQQPPSNTQSAANSFPTAKSATAGAAEGESLPDAEFGRRCASHRPPATRAWAPAEAARLRNRDRWTAMPPWVRLIS